MEQEELLFAAVFKKAGRKLDQLGDYCNRARRVTVGHGTANGLCSQGFTDTKNTNDSECYQGGKQARTRAN